MEIHRSMPSEAEATRRADETFRRVLDVAVAGAGLVLLSPLFLGLAVAVKLQDGGPVFYRARRVGQEGREFMLFKFRSMKADADRTGPGITTRGDVRVTRVGRFLRRTKLDELPQLFNVLHGEMSLVGPRPEDPRFVALLSEAQREILKVKPGITGAASLAFRHEEQLLTGPDWERVYQEEVVPAKLSMELEYIQTRTWRSDLAMLFKTVKVVFFH